MLFIYDRNRTEYIQSNVDIKEQYKRLFLKYTSNLAFFSIQTSKKLFDRHKTFVNVKSLRDRSYFFSFQFFLNKSLSKFNNRKS